MADASYDGEASDQHKQLKVQPESNMMSPMLSPLWAPGTHVGTSLGPCTSVACHHKQDYFKLAQGAAASVLACNALKWEAF